MLDTSSDYKKAISARCRRINHSRITIGGTVLTGETVRSITISEAVNDSDTMMPGCICSAQANVKIKYQSGVGYAGQQMVIERGIELEDGSVEYVLMGTFWITDPSSSDDYKTVDLVAQDAIVKMGGTYYCNLSFPTTVATMIQDVVSQAGLRLVTSVSTLPDITISEEPEGYSYREILGYLAGMCGKFVRATREGDIEISWYKDTGKLVETDQIIMSGFKRLNDSPIRSRFSVYTDLGETLVYPDIPGAGDDDEEDDPEADDTNVDSEWALFQDPRPITGLVKWAIIDGYMLCFSNDISLEWNLAGTKIVVSASQILWSENTMSTHTYPEGWGTFSDYTAVLSITTDAITACNFNLSLDVDTPVFTYTPGAAFIGDNFGVPSSGSEIAAQTRYSWDIGKYFEKCPFCTFDPTDESAYYDDTLVYCPLNVSGLPRNWVMYYDPSSTVSNVSLLDGTARLTQGYFTLVYAPELWFTTGNNDPSVDHITFTLHSSYPRYWFRMGFPNDESGSREYIWKLYKVDSGPPTYDSGDDYRLPLPGSTAATIQSYIRGVNAGFLFYTDIMASSCDIYNEPYYPNELQTQMGYQPYGSHLVFPATREENIHSCENGNQVIPNKPSTTDPDGNTIKYDSGATDYTNPLITKDMLNAIQAAMPVTEYMPCDVQWRGDPSYEPGDMVIVRDRYGTKWTVPIMQQTLTFQGGLNANIRAPGLTEQAAKFTSSSSISRSVRRVRADLKRQQATS